jgi:hypothetical protein
LIQIRQHVIVGKVQSYVIYKNGQVVEEKYLDKQKEIEMRENPKGIDYNE